MKKVLLFSFLFFLWAGALQAQIITTVAGIDSQGYNGDNIAAVSAKLNGPYDVAVDNMGNFYVADGYNNRIRKVNSAGIITTIAGNDTMGYNGDNIPATAAHLYRPGSVICDHFGNIYFSDAYNNRVRKIDASGMITTIAGNGSTAYNGENIPATSAGISDPHCLALDQSDNLYITDVGNSRIRKVDNLGIITTIAGTGTHWNSGDGGPATAAEIDFPYGIAVDDTGNIYFADYNGNVVRKISTVGIISTIVGKTPVASPNIGDFGMADSAKLSSPTGLALDSHNNIYIADALNQRIRKVTVASGIITTFAGNGLSGYEGDTGPAYAAEFSDPTGLVFDAADNLYIADFGNQCIRYVNSTEGVSENQSNNIFLDVWPNPNHGSFTINMRTANKDQMQIVITNIFGEKVKELKAVTNVPTVIAIDVAPGIYSVSCIMESCKLSNTVVIK
jgi:hypothetical protein